MTDFNNLPPYGLNTTSGGKYNLYASNTEVDLAEQSECHLIKRYIQQIKNRLIPQDDELYDNNNGDKAEDDASDDDEVKEVEIKTNPISELTLLECTMEKLVINAEERVRRTINTTMDPNHSRSHTNPGDECSDKDRPSTSKLNFTTMLNLMINNMLAINE